MNAAAALCGAGVGLGVLLVVVGLRRTEPSVSSPGGPSLVVRVAAGRSPRQVAGALCAAAVVGLLTRWPVAALGAGIAVWTLPALLARQKGRVRQLAQIEAIATWTESLRDTLIGGAGLEQAIVATAGTAPAPIRTELQALVDTIRARGSLPQALRIFAASLDDPIAGDLVAASLILAVTRASRDLAGQLGQLAAFAREEVAARQRIERSRAKAATQANIVIGATLAMAGGLIVFNRGYLHPYDSAGGQVVLAVVAVLFAVGFRWLGRMATPTPPDHVLATHPNPQQLPAATTVSSNGWDDRR